MRIDCCVSYFQKQLIGLLPRDIECLFYYAPDVNVDSYNVDGILFDDPTSINAALNPYGIYYTLIFVPPSVEPRFILTYVGTEPPTYLPAITDNNGDPVTWGWTTCCTKVCLEMTIYENDYSYFQNGYGYVCYPPTSFDDQAPMEIFLKSLYGQQTTYTAVYNPSDATYFITINNAYVCNPPLAWSGDNVTYTDMVPCGTPVCLYTTGTFNDSTGNNCFTLPGYDFNGQGIDFTAAANVYGGYAIQYGNSGTIPYGFDICSIIQFSYTGYSQPADVIVNDPIVGIINLPLGFQCCEKGCLTTNSILLKDTYDGILIAYYINLPFSSFGTATLDFVNDMVGAETYLNVILSKFCPGATCNVTSDGADYFTITFNDIYYNPSSLDFQLMDNNGIPSITTTLVPC